MLKQILTSGSVLALVLTSGLPAQARLKEPMLQSQAQEAPSTTPTPDSITSPAPSGTTTPTPDGITSPDPSGTTTTPAPDGSTVSPSGDSNTRKCESISVTSPSGGGTRERLGQAQQCNRT